MFNSQLNTALNLMSFAEIVNMNPLSLSLESSNGILLNSVSPCLFMSHWRYAPSPNVSLNLEELSITTPPTYTLTVNIVATSLFLNVVPFDDSIHNNIESSPFAPVMHTGVLYVTVLLIVVAVLCQIYIPGRQAGAVSDQPVSGGVAPSVELAYSQTNFLSFVHLNLM